MRSRWIILNCLFALIAHHAIAQVPTEFIENKGQWGSWIKFRAQTMGGQVDLEPDGFRYILCDPLNTMKIDSFHTGILKDPTMKFHVYKMTFEGANDTRN